MQTFADLLKAIAALLWPVFAFVALFAFRADIRAVLPRLKRGKLLGQEIELQESLVALESSAQQAVAAVATVPQLPSASAAVQVEVAREQSATDRIVAEAARSPKVALIMLAIELESSLRKLLASLGEQLPDKPLSFRQGLRVLAGRGGLPSFVAASAIQFYDVRSRLLHGHRASDDEVLSAIDSGITILRVLSAIPHEQHYVIDPGADVYYNAGGTLLDDTVKAVVIESRTPAGEPLVRTAFPTTRKHFKKGMRVAWEWNPAKTYTQLWYRNSDTGGIEVGWTGSAEFVGRSLDDI